MSGTLPLFWELASLDAEKREQATRSLIVELAAGQTAHQAAVGEKWQALLAEEDTLQRLESLCAQDVLYALKRLVRGLPSPRQGARQGFSLALAELLALLPFLGVRTLVAMMLQETAVNGGMSGQEERDMLFGRIFGYMSIVRSGALRRTSTEASDVMEMVDRLLDYGRTKPFLREAAHHVLVDTIPELLQRSSDGAALLDEMTARVLAGGVLTPDALLYALALESTRSKPAINRLSGWSLPIVQAKNLTRLASLLREQAAAKQEGKDDQHHELHSVWHPQLHSAWKQLLPEVFENTTASTITTVPSVPFAQRWTVLVDDGLFGDGTSHERKFWGFLLVQRAVQRLSSDLLSVVFSKRMMHSLTENLASKERYLHECARATSIAMQSVQEGGRAVILERLVGEQGDMQFDQRFGMTVVATLTRALSDAEALTYVQYLIARFASPSIRDAPSTSEEDVQRAVAPERHWVLQQLGLVARAGQLSSNATRSSITLIEDALIMYGFLEPQEKTLKTEAVRRVGGELRPPLDTETRQLCRRKLTTLLVNAQPRNGKEEGSTTSCIVDAARRFGELLEGDAYTLAEDIDDDTALPITEAALSALETIKQRVQAVPQDDTSLRQKLRAFEVLFAHIAFEGMTAVEEYGPLVDDMTACFIRLFPLPAAKKSKKGKKKQTTDMELASEDEPAPMVVLMDALLSLAARPPAVLRDLTKIIFSAFCQDMTQDALYLILKALQVGQDNDAMEDEEASSEHEDDAMQVDGESGEESGSVDDDDDEDDDEDSDLDYDVSETEADDSMLSSEQIHKALRKSIYRKQKDDDDDDDESDAESLGDDDMAPFDRALEAMFRERKSAKAEKKQADEAALNFQLRLLDLLEVFARRQSSNPLMLDAMLPVLLALRDAQKTAGREVFARRISALLQQRFCRLKEPLAGLAAESAVAAVTSMLAMLHDSDITPEMSNIVSGLCSQIVRSLLAQQDDVAVDQVMGLYSDLLDRYCRDKQTRITESVFLEIVRRYPLAGLRLLAPLAKHLAAGTPAKSYRQTQLFQLLTMLAQSLPKGNTDCEQRWLAAVPELASAFATVLQRLQEAESPAPAQIKAVVRCANGLIRRTNIILSAQPSPSTPSLSTRWQSETLLASLEPLAAKLPGQAIKSLVNEMQRLFSGLSTGTTPNNKRKRVIPAAGEKVADIQVTATIPTADTPTKVNKAKKSKKLKKDKKVEA